MSRKRRRLSYVRGSPKFPWLWALAAGAAAAVAVLFKTSNPISNALVSALRKPQDILDAVASVDPEGNPELQPGYAGGASWCNKFIALVTAKLGVPLPSNTLANDMISYMDAGNDGWYQVSNASVAQSAAMVGKVAIATYYNFSGHGHMALVLPIDGPVQIAQAGATNFNQGSLSRGFGFIQAVFYVHD